YKSTPEALQIMAKDYTKPSDRPTSDSEARISLDAEWFVAMFEGTPIPTNVFDLDGNIIAANEAIIEFAGVSSFEDLRGFNLFDDPNMSHEMKERLRNGEDIRYQSKIDFQLVREFNLYPTERTDIAYVESAMSVLQSPRTEKKIGYVVQLLDISKQKKLETKLRQSENKYKQLSGELEMIMDAIPGLVSYKDRNGNYIRVNKFVADAHNMSKEEVIGKSTFDLYPESQAKAYRQKELEVMESGEPKRNITEPWITDEDAGWISTSLTPLRDDRGEITGVVGISIDITARKRAEKKLKESEKQLRKVLKSVPAGLVLVDSLTKRIIKINPAVSDITGYSRDELVGELCTNTFCVAQEDECPITDLGQTIDNSEQICRTKDGRRIPVLKTVARITLNEHEYLLESFLDISAQKSIEEVLRASKERYRHLIEVLPEGVAIADLDERIELANEALGEIFGYEPEQLVGTSLLDYLSPEYTARISEGTRRREKGVESSYEIQIIHSSGEKRDVHLTAAPRLDGSGNTIGSIGVFVDVSERREAERELRETTHKLRERMKEMNALYAMANLSRKIDIRLSEAMQSLTQVVRDAFQYPSVACVRIIIEGNEYATSNFEKTEWTLSEDIWCEGERIGLLEVCYLEMRPESDHGPFLAEEINLLSAMALQIGDYINHRRTQERRDEQQRELELYASLLLHDLKNDLSAILGTLDILRMLLTDSDDEVRRTISSADAVCERMNNLLTTLSRPAESVETNLYNLIDAIAAQTTKEEPELTIDIDVGPDAREARIPASRLLPMVFENLFRNSLAFLEENPTIRVRISEKNGMVEALISDNGPGVTEEIRDKLFERGTSTRGGGMGLYLSKQIVEGLGGSMELVDTPPSTGATFQIVLPMR
ncbi:MAG: PAS domain-containing sensor histidine kinase, partial [Promethearchaeia archaeon]